MYEMTPFISKEFKGYFRTPLAFVFLIIFLLFQGVFTFYLGQFIERSQASLEAFFVWLPWLLLFFVPAIGMRLWSEERREGTIELLWTLPTPMWKIVVAKYLAALAFLTVAIACTFPFWIIVNFLGEPDNTVILLGYIGSIFLSGSLLAICSCMSACTQSHVIAFILSLSVCFLFTVSSFPLVLDFFQLWLPHILVELIAYFSFITHIDEMARGLLSLQQIIYFFSLIALWLYATVIVLHIKRET